VIFEIKKEVCGVANISIVERLRLFWKGFFFFFFAMVISLSHHDGVVVDGEKKMRRELLRTWSRVPLLEPVWLCGSTCF